MKKKYEKFCQSCVMPLNDTNRGTNSDNTFSDMYCNLCYQDSKFTKPNCTFEQMLVVAKEGVKKQKINPLKKWLILVSYKSLLKNVQRWKKN